jgi:hypothetical protein
MNKLVIVLIIVIIILLIGNFYITREGFFSEATTASLYVDDCDPKVTEDSNCNRIDDAENPMGSYLVHNVCPKDPSCIGICINDHTWTSVNKPLNYDNSKIGSLKNNEFSHLITSSRCTECIKNFHQILKLIKESKTCN